MSYLRNLLFLSVVFTFTGCGDGEVPPPKEAPEMSAEETANMESQMEMMKEMRSKGGKK